MKRRAFLKNGLWILGAPSLILSKKSQAQSVAIPGSGVAWAKPVTSSGPVTEIADNFTIGADADLNTHTTSTGGYTWVKDTGTIMDIASLGKAQDSSASATGYHVNHTMSTADYTVQCDVAYPNNTDLVEADLLGRFDAVNTSYFIMWQPDTTIHRLYKRTGGSNTQLGSNLTLAGTSHTLKLVMSGTTISGYTDGNLIASVTDAAIAGPGVVGIGPSIRASRFGGSGANLMTYDNLLVTVP